MAKVTETRRKTITYQLKRFCLDRPPGCNVRLVDPDDLSVLDAVIEGPQGTPYADAYFPLKIGFPYNYPSAPPEVSFVTMVYHPHINNDGRIAIDILGSNWSPELDLSRILLSVRSLLSQFDLDLPLVPDIAHEYKTSPSQFEAKAKEWTKRYASEARLYRLIYTNKSWDDESGRPANLSYLLRKLDDHPVAQGGYSDIWLCEWREVSWGGYKAQRMAVKVQRWHILGISSEKIKELINRELSTWKRLSPPRIVPLLGISYDFGPFPAFVSAWMESGSVPHYLKNQQPSPPLSRRMQLLFDISEGVSYLHEMRTVHGDLKGANVLVDESGRASVTDFGLSRVFDDSGASCTISTLSGSLRWMAPELFDFVHPSRRSFATDMYAFGGVILEVLAERVPYHTLQNDAQVVLAIHNGDMPEESREPLFQKEAWDFAQKCWSRDPMQRPTSEVAHQFLRKQYWRYYKQP